MPGRSSWAEPQRLNFLAPASPIRACGIEIHISNVHKRESFRHHSFVSHRADGVICGLGTEGYQLAIRRAATMIKAADKG